MINLARRSRRSWPLSSEGNGGSCRFTKTAHTCLLPSRQNSPPSDVTHVGVGKYCIGEVGVGEIGTIKVGVGKVSLGEVGTFKVNTGKVRVVQICITQVGVELRVGQVGCIEIYV